MKHEKTFEAINKLKDIEIELHRLKNALEIANKALDAQRTWVGLTEKERTECFDSGEWNDLQQYAQVIEAKLKQKNGYNT
jgi:hypothetical protein